MNKMSEQKEMSTQTETTPQPDIKKQLTKLALELGPLVVFFVVNARGKSIMASFPQLSTWFSQPIIFATAVFMVAMAISLAVSLFIFKRVAVMPLVTAAVVLVFGGLTLYFQDSTFIKMKPTIVNVLFGGILLGGMLFGHSLLKYVFGEVYRLKPKGWAILTMRWGVFFLILAVLNEVVWRNFSDDAWVAFKVWGVMPITLVFSMAQLPVMTRYNDDLAEAAE